MTTTLVDLRVGPYDSVKDIKAEIERIKALGDDPGIRTSIEQLNAWLKR